ncbi:MULTISPECIES: hypothetical protein [unclassified Butyrivibrio]|uniref:hypothetical protein n=1 Tax=unclassified Butyrivibrio TaxID=2639466 RepID=UPI0004145083|nr:MULTISPECIES: hypothetical protein [unclassified Butyrivibrio]
MSEHTHTYTHEHDGSQHTHTYTHDHENGAEHHDHDHHEHHHHDHPMENKEQVKALLDYNYKHNTSHADELTKLADKLESLGFADASAKVSEAEKLFSEGNANLKAALDLISGD